MHLRVSILAVVLVAGGPAVRAQPTPHPPIVQPLVDHDHGPPSKALERAIRLYDKKDFYSASIELTKILRGESEDHLKNRHRAEFFLGKTFYQLGFHGAALGPFHQIQQQGPDHTYFFAVAKWSAALIRGAPGAGTLGLLRAYRGDPDLETGAEFATIRDELRLYRGRERAPSDELATRATLERVDAAAQWAPGNVPLPGAAADADFSAALTLFARIPQGSPWFAPAQLEIARLRLGRGELDRGIEAAMVAARDPGLRGEAARVIASSTRALAAPEAAWAALTELGRTDAYAAFQLSRAALERRPDLAGFAPVSTESFDAVVLASACHASRPDDVLAVARPAVTHTLEAVTPLLRIDDDNDLAVAISRLRGSIGGDVVGLALADRGMRERFAWSLELMRQEAAVRGADRAWQTTEAAAVVMQELAVQRSLADADIGHAARPRLARLRADLVTLARVLATGPRVAAGPDDELVVTAELCRGAIEAMPIRSPEMRTPRPGGCAGCATTGPPAQPIVLAILSALAFARRRRSR